MESKNITWYVYALLSVAIFLTLIWFMLQAILVHIDRTVCANAGPQQYIQLNCKEVK